MRNCAQHMLPSERKTLCILCILVKSHSVMYGKGYEIAETEIQTENGRAAALSYN